MPDKSSGKINPAKLYPSYLNAFKDGSLANTTEKIFKSLESCSICPRKCQVNRLKNELGFCKTGLKPRIYSFMPHHGEEPPISGTNGSGTIFFSGCNMACVYCQNYKFSQTEAGKEMEFEELAEIMLKLQKQGCHNINLVTPTHVLPQILKALNIAIAQGLKIPLVYNTGGYENPSMIKLLEGIVDIYLADMRYGSDKSAMQYSSAGDYVEFNQASIKEMHAQVGIAQINNNGIIKKGLIIRHLVLPNNLSGSKEVFEFISTKISPETYISLMSQYTPFYKAEGIKEISRQITKNEYRQAEELMQNYGLHNGWVQEEHGLEDMAGTNIKPSF